MGRRRRGGRRLTSTPHDDTTRNETLRRETPRRPDASMSLLVDVMTHTVDQGYEDAALRKRRASEARLRESQALGQATGPHAASAEGAAAPASGDVGPFRWPGRATVLAAVVLVVAGGLFATAAVKTHEGDAAAKRDRQRLVQQVEQQQSAADALQKQADTLGTQITNARDGALAAADRSGALRTQLAELDGVDGAVAVAGTGVRIVLDDAPSASPTARDGSGIILDSDVRRVVNGLFAAGAEAIAVNGQRLTTQTAIREAGGAILVDYRPLSPPYSVEAIGPPTLGTAFQAGDAGQLFTTEHQLYGLGYSLQDHQRLTLPAAATLVVHYAKPLDTP